MSADSCLRRDWNIKWNKYTAYFYLNRSYNLYYYWIFFNLKVVLKLNSWLFRWFRVINLFCESGHWVTCRSLSCTFPQTWYQRVAPITRDAEEDGSAERGNCCEVSVKVPESYKDRHTVHNSSNARQRLSYARREPRSGLQVEHDPQARPNNVHTEVERGHHEDRDRHPELSRAHLVFPVAIFSAFSENHLQNTRSPRRCQ